MLSSAVQLRLAAVLGLASLTSAAVKMRVHELDPAGMNSGISRHRRFLVLMHEGDAATEAFQPWLFAIANEVPAVPIARIDVARHPRIAATFQVNGTTPTLKLFLRDNPKGKRVIDYTGALEFDPLLDWVQAVGDDREHELSAQAYEPPEPPKPPPGAKGRSSFMDGLPDSVRQMAETMVRETRLTRLLKEQGGSRVEQYQRQVHTQYQKIIADEKIELSDKFKVQDANRRARDIVREEVLENAPSHIKDEVLGEVNLGDMAKRAAPAGGGGGLSGATKALGGGKKDEL